MQCSEDSAQGKCTEGQGVARNKRLGLVRGAALFWNFRSVVRATSTEIKSGRDWN